VDNEWVTNSRDRELTVSILLKSIRAHVIEDAQSGQRFGEREELERHLSGGLDRL
jgi:hypothetical protein